MRTEERAVWDQRDDEGARAYSAFSDYLAMGSGRSLRALYQVYTEDRQRIDSGSTARQRTERPPTTRQRTLFEWSTTFEWTARAAAYDAHLQIQARKDQQEEYLRDLDRMRRRQKKFADQQLRAAALMLRRAKACLRELEAKDLDPGKLPAYFRTAAYLAETATNMEAVALGVMELIQLLEEREGDDS